MKVSLSLSSKVDANGLSEILLSAQMKIAGKVSRMRAKSEVYVSADFFSKEKGVEMPRKRLISPAVREWHISARDKLNGILSAVATAEMSVRREYIHGSWLRDTVARHLHPDNGTAAENDNDFYLLADEYLRIKDFSQDHTKGFRSLVRAVARYEGFVQARVDEYFSFDIDTVGRKDMEGFMEYLRGEKGLSERFPSLFERLTKSYPANVRPGHAAVEARGSNTVIKLMKKLKAFFGWLYETGRTRNRPFDGIRIGSEKYGTPFYLTRDERERVACMAMPSAHLERQRDIFVFQCLVGCRVSDLMRLTEACVKDGVLEYTPRKTKDDGNAPAVARVPLLPQAVALIEKYRDVDAVGRIFPFISPQRYNDAIKEILTLAGITRIVEIRDSLSGEIVLRPINEVASSHMARRTFIGNLYQQVQDPNLIGKMSGHVEGSTAFARYRKIEDDTLRSVIEKIM